MLIKLSKTKLRLGTSKFTSKKAKLKTKNPAENFSIKSSDDDLDDILFDVSEDPVVRRSWE